MVVGISYDNIEQPFAPYDLKEKLKTSCWIASDDTTLTYGNHPFHVQPTMVVSISGHTITIGADGKKIEEDNPTHYEQFKISWTSKNFFNSKITDHTEFYDTETRPGLYDKSEATQNCLRLDR